MRAATANAVKIAFLLGEFPSLSETFILDQITALIDRGHSVSIFAERPSRDVTMHPAVVQYDLLTRTRYEHLPAGVWRRVIGLPPVWRWSRPMWRSLNVLQYGWHAASLRLAWAVQMIDQCTEFDIIQCHFGALGLKAVLLRGTGAISGTVVTAFHGEDITNYPQNFADGHYAPLFAHGELFQPVSARWNGALEALGCPMHRVRVHRMGVDLSGFSMRDAPVTQADPIRILAVSRLVEKKGLRDAVCAVAQLQLPCEFVIVGDGPLRTSLQALVDRLGVDGSIRLAGALPRHEIAALLQKTDIFLAPSVTAPNGDIEGIPVAIMEAMASGIPVVSTRHSGIPELVQDNVSGFLLEEGDVAGLTCRLSRLAYDAPLRRRMGAAGRRIVAAEFDVRTLTDQLLASYVELLATSGTTTKGQHQQRQY